MTVKRWSVGVDGPDENGNLVAGKSCDIERRQQYKSRADEVLLSRSYKNQTPESTHSDYLSLAAESSSLRLTIDNIVKALGLGDGPVSRQVIELVTGLTAENEALKFYIKTKCYVFDPDDDSCSVHADIDAEKFMPKTPANDAAIAEIKAQGIDWLIETVSPEWLESYVKGAKRLAATLRAGGKAL